MLCKDAALACTPDGLTFKGMLNDIRLFRGASIAREDVTCVAAGDDASGWSDVLRLGMLLFCGVVLAVLRRGVMAEAGIGGAGGGIEGGGGGDTCDSVIAIVCATALKVDSLCTTAKFFFGDEVVDEELLMLGSGDSTIVLNFGLLGEIFMAGGKVPDFCIANGTPDRRQLVLYEERGRKEDLRGVDASFSSRVEASLSTFSAGGEPATELA